MLGGGHSLFLYKDINYLRLYPEMESRHTPMCVNIYEIC